MFSSTPPIHTDNIMIFNRFSTFSIKKGKRGHGLLQEAFPTEGECFIGQKHHPTPPHCNPPINVPAQTHLDYHQSLTPSYALQLSSFPCHTAFTFLQVIHFDKIYTTLLFLRVMKHVFLEFACYCTVVNYSLVLT